MLTTPHLVQAGTAAARGHSQAANRLLKIVNP